MNKTRRALVGFTVLVAIVLLIRALEYDPVAELRTASTALRSLPAWLVAAVFVLSLLNYALRYLRWHRFIAVVGTPPPPVDHILIYLGGFALTLTPGKVGEAFRSTLLTRYAIRAEGSLAAFVVERAFDLIAMVILAVGALEFAGDSRFAYVIALMLVCVALIALIHPRLVPAVTHSLRGYAPAILKEKITLLLDRAEEIILTARRLAGGHIAMTVILSLLAWLAEGVGLWLLARHFNPGVGVVLGIGIYALSVLLGALTFLPGGLGGTEIIMSTMLVAVGLSLGEAAVVTLVCRIATLWFAIGLGVSAVALLGLLQRQREPGEIS